MRRVLGMLISDAICYQARFKLRKALLHWRHRKLTLSFRSLVTMVFRTRIEEAKRCAVGHIQLVAPVFKLERFPFSAPGVLLRLRALLLMIANRSVCDQVEGRFRAAHIDDGS